MKRDGVYHKFRVERTDGGSEPGQKHFGCEYFVLDTIHDPHAKAALLAYADSCEAKYPQLAADARRMANGERVLAALSSLEAEQPGSSTPEPTHPVCNCEACRLLRTEGVPTPCERLAAEYATPPVECPIRVEMEREYAEERK